jgi:hypothetical protein
MCPGFPGVGLLGCGHAMGSAVLARSSYSIGVSMPGEECRRRRLWKISRYRDRALASSAALTSDPPSLGVKGSGVILRTGQQSVLILRWNGRRWLRS